MLPLLLAGAGDRVLADVGAGDGVWWWWLLAGFLSLCSINYLVDPASSHMLVSKIKPCMCQYRPL